MGNSSAEASSPDSPAFLLSAVRFREILDIDHLELNSCRITAVVGPSGGGKTTLLRCLNRMTTPDAGQILFRGRPLEAIKYQIAIMLAIAGSVGLSVFLATELGYRRFFNRYSQLRPEVNAPKT